MPRVIYVFFVEEKSIKTSLVGVPYAKLVAVFFTDLVIVGPVKVMSVQIYTIFLKK